MRDNTQAALHMDLASNPDIRNVILQGNSYNALEVESGSLAASAAWDDPGVVYYLTGNVTVPAGMTLTIASGQVVKPKYYSANLIVNGTFDARGTVGAPIIFTSEYDDTAGSDINGSATAPAWGQRGGIQIKPGSTGSVMEYVELRYGGYNVAGEIYVAGGGLTLPRISVVLDAIKLIEEFAAKDDQLAEAKVNLERFKREYVAAVNWYRLALNLLGECIRNPNARLPPPPMTVESVHDKRNGSGADPNDKVGPSGFGIAGFIQPGAMPYEIMFENDPNAGATLPAQEVVVTDVLDADLDLSTLEFTSFGFNNMNFTVPAGLSHYSTTLDLRPQGINLRVPVALDLNTQSRTLSATFRSLDPTTGQLPDAVDAGFLPVNDKDLHNGDGYFTYTLRPLAGLLGAFQAIQDVQRFLLNDLIGPCGGIEFPGFQFAHFSSSSPVRI